MLRQKVTKRSPLHLAHIAYMIATETAASTASISAKWRRRQDLCAIVADFHYQFERTGGFWHSDVMVGKSAFGKSPFGRFKSPFGGGKAVILADKDKTKSPELLAAFADAVDALGDLLERRRLRGQRLRDAALGGGVGADGRRA